MKKNEKIYKIFVKPKKNQNYIVSILIGKKTNHEWDKFSKRLVIQYCKNNNIGLVVFYKNLVCKKGYYSKPVFNKYLFADYFRNNLKFVKNVCYLDHDILCNPLAPNIFKKFKKNKFSVVSKYKNTPYDRKDDYLKRKAAFMRKAYYQSSFPLDSALTISRSQTYHYHNWRDLGDYFCSGLLMFNIKEQSEFLKNIYNHYKEKNISTLTKGEEPIMNYEVLSKKKINWLEYKYQVLWLLEMNSRYPFLYKYKKNDKIVVDCIEHTLSENYFVHFSGKWPEGQMWKNKKLFSDKKIKFFKKFNFYLKKKLKSKPRKNLIKFKGKK